MGPRVGDLDPRQVERWRAVIAEVLGARLAYPPFYDYRAGRETVRPLDRAKREELQQFVRSANFSSLDASDVNSPDVRRFLERLMLRYLEVNPLLRGAASARRTAALRSRVPKIAAEVHRSLLGNPHPSAADGPPTSWLPVRPVNGQGDAAERNARILEAILTRGEGADVPPMLANTASRQQGSSVIQGGAAERWRETTDETIPVRTWQERTDGNSPYEYLGAGAQSGLFAAARPISERPTGPLPVAGDRQTNTAPSLPDDLYQLYGDYLRDMHPDSAATAVRPAPPQAPSRHAPPDAAVRPMAGVQASHAAATRNSAEPASAGPDVQIFYQLRYQLEAYVRRAARGYGVHARGDDAVSQLDALRRSGFVDEADLRLAEGILAVTDKVIDVGVATVEDFRQAMMLYLLYHRSHLGS